MIRPPLLKFAEEMEKQLMKNDWRKGWKDCSIYYLLDKARKNLNALGFMNLTPTSLTISGKERIIKCCVDCANFCMMIADNLREEVEE